jgi:hypothetical protein
VPSDFFVGTAEVEEEELGIAASLLSLFSFPLVRHKTIQTGAQEGLKTGLR